MKVKGCLKYPPSGCMKTYVTKNDTVPPLQRDGSIQLLFIFMVTHSSMGMRYHLAFILLLLIAVSMETYRWKGFFGLTIPEEESAMEGETWLWGNRAGGREITHLNN